VDKSILGVNVLITTVLIPRSTILIMGKMLRTAPNTVQRHFETLREASPRAMRISDADDILASGAMRDVRIGTRDFLAPVFYIVETLSARNTH
jgi:hypothetical protein